MPRKNGRKRGYRSKGGSPALRHRDSPPDTPEKPRKALKVVVDVVPECIEISITRQAEVLVCYNISGNPHYPCIAYEKMLVWEEWDSENLVHQKTNTPVRSGSGRGRVYEDLDDFLWNMYVDEEAVWDKIKLAFKSIKKYPIAPPAYIGDEIHVGFSFRSEYLSNQFDPAWRKGVMFVTPKGRESISFALRWK